MLTVTNPTSLSIANYSSDALLYIVHAALIGLQSAQVKDSETLQKYFKDHIDITA